MCYNWLSKPDRDNVELLKCMQKKVTEKNPELKLMFLHYTIHQEILCKSVLQINLLMLVITW